MRAGRALRIVPKSLLLRVETGAPKFTKLNVLKNSARNCTLLASLIGKFFTSAISQLVVPGARIRFRPELPNWKGAGCVNAPGLTQLSRVWFEGVRATPGTRLGRCAAAY